MSLPVTSTVKCIDVITRAWRAAGIGAAGEVLSGDDLNDIALILNGMLDGWLADGLYIYNQSIMSFALTSNVQSYPIGPTAAAPFNVARPSRINNANLKILTGGPPTVETPLVILDDEGWMEIPVKNITGTYPTKLYYSPDYPNGTLFFWPIPTGGLEVVLDVWNQFSQFANINDSFNFPNGYFEAMYSNLGVRLSTPEWGVDAVSPSLSQLANESRARIQSLNASPPQQMSPDYGIQGVNRQTGYRNLFNPAPIWTR